MDTVQTTWGVSSHAHLTSERLLGAYLRVLSSRGWQERLAPLAQHMAERRLVRAPSDASAPLRRLDAEVLRDTLCRLLSEGDEGAAIVFDLVVEGMDPEWVAEDWGITVPVLTEQLRAAVQWVAGCYEARANGHLNDSTGQRMQAAPARKRG